jgi:tetratricopeptide (TPR) repeat protein
MAYSNLSLCYAQLGDKETAETYKAEATRLTMRLAMQAAMAKKQASGQASSTAPPPEETSLSPEQRATLEQRAELLQHALSVAPNDALALYGLGTTYFSFGQYQQAVTYLEQTVAVSPKHSKAYAQLATALLGLQQTAQAEAVAKQGLAVATTAGDLQVVAQLNTLLASLPALQGLG